MSKCPQTVISNNLTIATSHLWQPLHLPNRREPSPPKLSNLLQIHSFLIVSGFSHNSSLLTRLLLHCLSVPSFPPAYALSIFRQIRCRNVAIYNAVIGAFRSDPQNVASLYVRMRREGIFPNKHTFPLLFKSKIPTPFQIFGQAIKLGFGSDRFLRNSLISVFGYFGLIRYARQVFDEMPDRDAVAYTALMDGYVKHARAPQTLELFLEMKSSSPSSGVAIDEVAVVTALCAAGLAGCVWLGKWIHGFYVVSGRVAPDIYVRNALVDMYSKIGSCDDAAKVFEEISYKNIVCWNALLSGYVQCNRCKDALLLFQAMLSEKVGKVEPNDAVLATGLAACAGLGALDKGRWINKYISLHKMELNSVLGTALIDMYAKCGCIQDAFQVFDRMQDKDVYPWTALTFGLAINGDAMGALSLFVKMLSSGVQPNEVTFIAVLCACSHGGLVNEGREVFASMEGVYGIKPTVDHYGCMVDLLGRAGQLEEAVKLIEGMPMEPSPSIWGALFSACTMHKDIKLGRSLGNHLIRLQPNCSGRYTLLVNLYGECCDREAEANVRKKMNKAGVGKSPGCSWIEVDGILHEFLAFDSLHGAIEDIYDVLDSLTGEIRQVPVCCGSS